MSLLPELLIQHRKATGLSQVEVEERTGITQGYVSALERGRRVPSLDVLGRLADAYGLSPEERGRLGNAAIGFTARSDTPTQDAA